MGDWTLLTNHGHVLIHLGRHPDARISELSDAVGITERAAQRIVADLVAAGYVERERVGRRNRYSLRPDARFRHPLERDHQVGVLLAALDAERGVQRDGAHASS